MASTTSERVGRRRTRAVAPLDARLERRRTLQARARLELLRRDYIGTENPLLAWEAVVTCRAARLPLPTWALATLADAGERLLGVGPAGTPEDWAPVASALGLRSDGAWPATFTGYQRLRDEWRLALEVSQGLESGKTRAEAVAHAARANQVSQRAAERAYDRLRQAFEVRY